MSDPQFKTKTPLSESNLFSRSVKADQDDWLVFTIQETLPAQVEYEKLRTWLENNRPSKVTRESGVGWISVRLGSVTIRVRTQHLLIQLRSRERRFKSAEAKAEWESIEGERTMGTINNLASKFGDMGGKWLFHVSTEFVDRKFSSLALLMVSGGLRHFVNR